MKGFAFLLPQVLQVQFNSACIGELKGGRVVFLKTVILQHEYFGGVAVRVSYQVIFHTISVALLVEHFQLVMILFFEIL
ncbi:MAG: hypothetical protein ICV66_14105 [Chitinophagaceae bacterium]|nr:hypothetical protein [Chitinophagaceae bacterium]